MFPMQFNRKTLDGLPFPDDDSVKRIRSVLKAIVVRRIMPYFRNKRGTDASSLAKVTDRMTLHRFQDEDDLTTAVSLISRAGDTWQVHIHERVFDYLAFVIPSHPDSRLGGETAAEGQVLAFAEFLLRHEIEHMLYTDKTEREVVRSDVGFAMEERAADPTFYRMLRRVLADEMNGLEGGPYLALLDAAETERPYEQLITRMLDPVPSTLANLPDDTLVPVFLILEGDLKTKLLGLLYEKSREMSFSLVRRFSFLNKVFRLFGRLNEEDPDEAGAIFEAFKSQWGLVNLLRELDAGEMELEGKAPGEIFSVFMEHLRHFIRRAPDSVPGFSTPRPAHIPEGEFAPAPAKSLKERIDEARHDPAFPRQAMEVIDKNKTSAVGHSGPKYTELIETLLAIPWGKIQRLQVSTEAFEEGLNRSHYGLQKPKELVSDIFSNLIWRYRQFSPGDEVTWKRTGSAFLFVGPPGVGKTSLAISIASNLGIPYHKISLGGMKDEADLRGYGFTYEGSKPGAIVQGLIKMGVMNGMFIMDEADKTEKFAVSTLLEILDPEQNHLFHDKYTMSTVDIDLSNCHFILTANSLVTVPPPVINRCELVVLDRYSVDEKIAIGRDYLIRRVRKRHQIGKEEIFFDPGQETEILRYLIKTYTHEPGVRELERIIRTLFLRLLRKEILAKGETAVRITRAKIKQYLDPPTPPRRISAEDRVGEMLGLGINVEMGVGSIIPVQATAIPSEGAEKEDLRGYLSMVQATGNIEKIMDESRRVATTGILFCADWLGIDLKRVGTPIHLHFMGASTLKDGPSAGGAIALALASTLSGRALRRDVAMTGEIDTQGRILRVGGLRLKLEIAYDAGCKTVIIPEENLHGEDSIERLTEALKGEFQILTYERWKGDREPFDYGRHTLQVVGVNHIVQAADISFIDEKELAGLEAPFAVHGREARLALKKDGLQESRGRVCVIYANTWNDLDFTEIDGAAWRRVNCVFVLRPEVKREILSRFPTLEGRVRFYDFDRPYEEFPRILKKIGEEMTQALPGQPLQLSVVAPFFFLKASGICANGGSAGVPGQAPRLFASNYSIQGLKMKSCKPLLNCVHCYLSQLLPARLDSLPFLGVREGMHCIDLSFIPEKYRLDLKRAEEIVNRGLRRWLTTVERGAAGPGTGRRRKARKKEDRAP